MIGSYKCVLLVASKQMYVPVSNLDGMGTMCPYFCLLQKAVCTTANLYP
jgi:hypothetical protein